MRLLLTGGAGFIGSHLVLKWLNAHPNDTVVNLDRLTYASDLKNLSSAEAHPNYRLSKTDLSDRPKVRALLQDFKPEGVIHLAAESHVDNSISGPEPFVLSNVVGTFNLLDECRQLWTEAGTLKTSRFLHVSTDEVFGQLGASGAFTEESPYRPNSPYSASKASSDHFVRAYHHTYGMNCVITNCSNNYGPHQHREKLIPTVIRTALAGKPIPVYGKGTNVRDWLYVEDHCSALELAFRKGSAGSEYAIGGRNEWQNLELVRKICDELNSQIGKGPQGDYKNLITFVTDRLGHDFRYAIDPSKIERDLGWKPSTDFDAHLRTTVRWFIERFRSE